MLNKLFENHAYTPTVEPETMKTNTNFTVGVSDDNSVTLRVETATGAATIVQMSELGTKQMIALLEAALAQATIAREHDRENYNRKVI